MRPQRGWPKPAALRRRAERYFAVKPPLRRKIGAMSVHAPRPTGWLKPVLAALPAFHRVGARLFGRSLPPVRVFLFSDRRRYVRFHRALFQVPPQTSWADGTGLHEVAVFCETPRRPAGETETLSNVLHELGHSWMRGYITPRRPNYYDARDWRPYLEEGIAEYVAGHWHRSLHKNRAQYIESTLAERVRARPSFSRMASWGGFYEEKRASLHYWLSALLVRRLLGGGEAGRKRLLRLLDAIANGHGHRQACLIATGRDPRAEFERLVREFWR